MNSEEYHIGFYWGVRQESAEECARRIKAMTDLFAKESQLFAKWLMFDKQWYELATMMQRRLKLDLSHPEVANSLHNLGTIQLGQGRYEKALDTYQKALDIRSNILPPDHQGQCTPPGRPRCSQHPANIDW